MHKKFRINQTKIKGGCQSGRKVVMHNSKSDLPLKVLTHSSSLSCEHVCCQEDFNRYLHWPYSYYLPLFHVHTHFEVKAMRARKREGAGGGIEL